MKYIFLDIDGVLNNSRTVARSPDGFIGISDSLGKRLEKIIIATGASVVLTSTWKDYSSIEDLNYMRKKLKRYKALPIGQIREPKSYLRGFGINSYLEKHPCEEFVILDDLCFDFDQQNLQDHVVLTDPYNGLSNDDAERAIKILNGDLSADNFGNNMLLNLEY